MALSFSEGSIGGDIERVNLDALAGLLRRQRGRRRRPWEPAAGTGASRRARTAFAIAPANTVNRRALLLINPHTSFFFRSELQVTSDEGLNAYGAATWGQFFIYQGFNERLGWMHTSSGADAVDEYAETIVAEGRAAVLSLRAGRAAGRRPSGSRSPIGRRAGMADSTSSRSTAPTTGRSCARRRASGSRVG